MITREDVISLNNTFSSTFPDIAHIGVCKEFFSNLVENIKGVHTP